MNDAFDPENFKLPPDMAADLAKARPKRHDKQPKRTEPFLQITHKAIAAGAKALGGGRILVWMYIHHRIWSDKSNTVAIGNVTLRSWGVKQMTKLRALHDLESAGLIAVEWRDRKSPLITLLARQTKLPQN